MSNVRHVYPRADLIEHVTDTEDDHTCPCGPDVEVRCASDAPDGYVVVHHSLDGREQKEQR